MTKTQIAKQVKAGLKAKKWTIYRISKQTGLREAVILSIINNSANYTIDSLLKVCKALEINHLGNVKEQV